MTEAEWLAANDPTPLLEFLRGKVSDRKLRLFAVACCRKVWHLLLGEQSRHAAEVTERFADGEASEQELWDARSNAWEFADYLVHNDEAYAHLDADAPNATDAPAWAAESSVQPIRVVIAVQRALGTAEGKAQPELLRCIFGNPFRPVTLKSSWLTATVLALANGIYEKRAFDRMPILADALQDAGCDNEDVLSHCRGENVHVRGCWVVDKLLAKE
jgi:hypothetical protein